MRFHPTPDPKFYVDVPDKWDEYCRYPAEKKWPRLRSSESLSRMWNVYNDQDGKDRPVIQERDLYLKDLQGKRLKPRTSLPYPVGVHFIKVKHAPPGGFNSALFPMNLREVRHVNDIERIRKILLKHKQWFDSWYLYECFKKKEFLRSPT